MRYRFRVILAISAILAAAFFQLLIPLFLGRSVDQAIQLISGYDGSSSSSVLISLTISASLLVGASILRGLLAFTHAYIGESIGQRISYRLRLAYYEKLQRLSFSYHDHRHTGDLITRGIVDIEGIRRFINMGFLRSIFIVAMIAGGAFFVTSIDLTVGLLALSFAPIVAWRTITTRLKLRSGWLEAQEKLSDLTKVMDENLGGIRVVRAFASQDYEMNKYERASQEVFGRIKALIGVRVLNSSLMNLAFFISAGLVLLFGGLRVIEGVMTIGDLTATVTFMGILQLPVQHLGLVVNAYAHGSSTSKRLFDVLDIHSDIEDSRNAVDVVVKRGVLKFEDVHFSYKDHPTLFGVSFTAEPNRTIGIVGPPGSGKSTIAHLIPRFYDPTSGRITIDGIDIKDMTLASLRKSVNVVEQDTFMFTTSVENNVAYGDPWATMQQIVSATKDAQLHDYIERMPLRYDSIVGERGVSLSGGQRQRLSIARSMMLDPSIIVFDDSTASIDAVTEQRIRSSLEKVTRKRTVIIISHRLSSLMHADEILLIKDGMVAERGSHRELLELGGAYRALYELQVGPADIHPPKGK